MGRRIASNHYTRPCPCCERPLTGNAAYASHTRKCKTIVVPNDATHAVVVTVEFVEGEPEERIVALGSFERCDEFARALPAVANSGPRVATSASVTVRTLLPFHGACGQRHPSDAECAPAEGLLR